MSSPLRPPPEYLSQFDDDDDAQQPALTQSDLDGLSASSADEGAPVSDDEMERIRHRQARKSRHRSSSSGAQHAGGAASSAAHHTAAAGGGSVRAHSPICIASTDDDDEEEAEAEEDDAQAASDSPPLSPLHLMVDDDDDEPPLSPAPDRADAAHWSSRDRSEGEVTPDDEIEEEHNAAAADASGKPVLQTRADSGGWVPAFSQTLTEQEELPSFQPRRHSSTERAAPHIAAAAATAPMPPVVHAPSSSSSRSASAFLAAAPRKDEIAVFSDDDERMSDEGDRPDPIEDFTPSPPLVHAAGVAAAATSASLPSSTRSVHAPFKPPRVMTPPTKLASREESSIDLTDSPPPSPSQQQWSDRFLPAHSRTAAAAAASAAAAPAPRPQSSAAAPSASRIGSAHALSAAMASSAPPLSRPIPTLSGSKLFNRLTPPMAAPSPPSASAAAATAAAQEAIFSEMFESVAAIPTPHTAALLSEGKPPILQRSQAAFMRTSGAEPHSSAAAAATSSFSRPPPSRPDAATVARLAARRQQEADDAAYVKQLMAEDAAVAASAAAAAAASSKIGAFQVSPAKRHKPEQASITSYLSPSKPSASSDAAAAASHAASSDAALNASSWPAPVSRKSIFTKQHLAHGQKRKHASSPDADDRENHDSSREHSREGSRSNSPFQLPPSDSLQHHRQPKTARDLIPTSVDQLHRSLPGFIRHQAPEGVRRAEPKSRSSKFKDAKHSTKQALAARVAASDAWNLRAAAAAAASAARRQAGSASPAPAAEPELSQLCHQPPPPLTSLRADHHVNQPKKTASELSRLVQSIQQKVAAKHELQRVELKLTPAQREANRRQEAEIRARREKHERKANETRRLQPSLDKLHADVLTWNVHEIDSSKSVAHKLHARLSAIPLQFDDLEHYQRIMYPLLLEECRASIEQQLEEMRGATREFVIGGGQAAAAGAKQNSAEPPVAAVFGEMKRTDKGNITMVETDLRIAALDASSSSAAAAAGPNARDSSRSSDRLAGFQHDDLVILWRNAPAVHHVGPLFEDEEGEIDQSLLARTDWTQASHAHLALLQDFDNKHELNRAENAASKLSEAVAAEAAASSHGGHHRRRDDPPFKLRLFFDSNDAHSNDLKRNFFSRSGAGGGGATAAGASAGGATSSGSSGSRWVMLKLQNLKTMHREYSALQSCGHLILKDAILKPATTASAAAALQKAAIPISSPDSSARVNPAAILSAVSRNVTLSLMQAQVPPSLSAQFNVGQLQAIAKVLMKREGFSLIQGPPGTGKTTTIVGLISMLHMQFQAKLFIKGQTSSYKPPGAVASTGAAGSAWARQLSSTAVSNLQRSSSSTSTKQFRLLVCAPSNAAINEIIDRMEEALVDCDGSKLQLNIVRLGAGSNKEKQAQAQARSQGDKGASAASMPFHDRISLDNLVREHRAAGGDAAVPGNADGSVPRSADLSTPLSVLKDRAARALEDHRASAEESNRIHNRIKELEKLIELEDMQAERELELKRAEAKRAASPAMAAAAAAPSAIVSQRAAFEKELADLEIKKRAVLQRKNEQKHVVTQLKSRERVEARTALSPTDSLRASILQGAHVILTTLSGAGIEFFRNLKLNFSSVIVDESAQSSEVASLIPLKYNVKRCILVGDPSQLSATVKSRRAVEYAWKQSLFQRLQLNQPEGVEMLTTQYRMHWEIVRWPSSMFYEGRLQTAPELCEELVKKGHVSMQPAAAAASSHKPKIDLRLAPYLLYDVVHGRESAGQRSSLFNTAEAEATVQLFLFLRKQLAAQASAAAGGAKSSVATVRPSSVALTQRIGVISPYQRQVSELRRRFASELSASEMAVLEIDSVDAFQGREKDFIIFSCVRAQADEGGGARRAGIGFLSEFARLNVALTRARLGMYIVAHAATVSQDATWSSLVADARARRRILTVPHNVRDLFRSPLWSETKWLADMEPCPTHTSAAALRADKIDGDAAAATAPGTKTTAVSSTAAVVAGSKTSPSAPKPIAASKTPRPVVPVAISPSVTGSGVAVSSSSNAAAATAASSSSSSAILSLEKVLKKPVRPEGSLFLNEQRTGVVRPPVPIKITTPASAGGAASQSKAHGATPMGVGSMVPLGSKHAAGPQPILKPVRPAGGGTAGAPASAGLSSATIAAAKLAAASKPASAHRPAAAAAASASSASASVPPVKRVTGPPPAASSTSQHAPSKPASAAAPSKKPDMHRPSKSKAAESSSSDSSSDDSSDDELLVPAAAGKSIHAKPSGAAAPKPIPKPIAIAKPSTKH